MYSTTPPFKFTGSCKPLRRSGLLAGGFMLLSP
jgi:hypothetical protein